MKTAFEFVKQAREWLGVREGSAKHKEILSIYNTHRPLAHGYEMKETDAWCATFVSAVSIKCGYTSIIPTDCRCSSLIEKFKKLGCWIEDESRTPKIGDIVFYDWEDNGTGNNKGTPNHVGIVGTVKGEKFGVIEGNKDNKVGTRTMTVNGKYIRGYAVPKYDSETSVKVETVSKPSYYKHTVRKGESLWRIAQRYGVTVDEIMKANKDLIKQRNLIHIGWVLDVPKKDG